MRGSNAQIVAAVPVVVRGGLVVLGGLRAIRALDKRRQRHLGGAQIFVHVRKGFALHDELGLAQTSTVAVARGRAARTAPATVASAVAAPVAIARALSAPATATATPVEQAAGDAVVRPRVQLLLKLLQPAQRAAKLVYGAPRLGDDAQAAEHLLERVAHFDQRA